MAEIRINKIIRQYNIGLDDLVSFLRGLGVDVDQNPNAKVSEEYLPAELRLPPQKTRSPPCAVKVHSHTLPSIS